ncbi:MAG: tetratricopeptide repeat protein [Polyangiales bacterium]
MVRRAILTLALSALPLAANAQESAVASAQGGASTPSGAVALGRALRRAGRFDEAVRALQPATRSPATRADAAWEIARVRFDQGNFRAAEAACRAFPLARAATDPRNLAQHVCMARAYLVWQRVALANRAIGLAGAIAPNDGELQLVIADARRLASEVPASEAAYRLAAQSLPGRSEPYTGLGALYEIGRRFDEAGAAYHRAVEVDSADPSAQLALGRFLLRRRGDAAAALPHLRAATAGRLHWPEALALLAQAQLDGGAPNEALGAAEEAARLSPTTPGVQNALGRARIAVGQYTQAEAPLREAIRQVDNDALAWRSLADVLEHTDRAAEAMQAWDAAIDRSPTEVEGRLRAAELAARTTQYPLARAQLERVLQDHPDSGPAQLLRARIALAEGDRATARQALDAANGRPGVSAEAIATLRAELERPVRRPRR